MKNVDEIMIREKYRKFTRMLIDRQLSISTMESATSGQLASLITDTEGSSAIFKGAFITYCNEAKIMQGVPAQIISEYGVYSVQTAHAMANACHTAYKADICIGITGTMGNVDPANNDSEPGKVYFAIYYNGEVYEYSCELEPYENRLSYKLAVCEIVLEECLKIIG